MKVAVISLALFLITLGHAFADFAKRIKTDQIKTTNATVGLRVTFLGTTTFLIEDENTQVLIDGFVTRFPHRNIHKLAPDEDHIRGAARRFGICNGQNASANQPNNPKCNSSDAPKLRYIIPMHGHYDHALDAPYWSALTGAQLVGDGAVDTISRASARYPAFSKPDLDWNNLDSRISLPDCPSKEMTELNGAGKIKIKLMCSPHQRNITSLILARPPKKFAFRRSIWAMRAQNSYSALVEYEGKKLVIVPSAGELGSSLSKFGIKADVVFLGIGGLGFKSSGFTERYWREAVINVDARRVVPVHWDDDQEMIPEDGETFEFQNWRRHGATLKQLDELALKEEPREVKIKFPPGARSFDPFHGLAIQSRF